MVKPSSFIINDVEYKILDESTVEVFKYHGSATDLTIPETVEGYKVVQIGISAFENNETIVSIDLPDTIVVICTKAFKNCKKLSTMK